MERENRRRGGGGVVSDKGASDKGAEEGTNGGAAAGENKDEVPTAVVFGSDAGGAEAEAEAANSAEPGVKSMRSFSSPADPSSLSLSSGPACVRGFLRVLEFGEHSVNTGPASGPVLPLAAAVSRHSCPG